MCILLLLLLLLVDSEWSRPSPPKNDGTGIGDAGLIYVLSPNRQRHYIDAWMDYGESILLLSRWARKSVRNKDGVTDSAAKRRVGGSSSWCRFNSCKPDTMPYGRR